MAGELEAFTARLMAHIENGLQIVGQGTVEYAKALVSKPVERLPGGVVIRSKPGEPPRRDTGDLQANLQMDVENSGAVVQLGVGSGRNEKPEVPELLEFGIGLNGVRPYMWGGAGLPATETAGGFSLRGVQALSEELKTFK